MAIKAGELIHVGNLVLLDRLQTAGPGSLTINTEKIYELGNYASIGTVRDNPDLTFTGESFDASTELESMLVGGDFDTDPAGQMYEIANATIIDVVSQFKAGRDAPAPFDTVASAALPYLFLEGLSYRFGISDNAAQTFTMRGDSIFFANASAYIQEVAGSGIAAQVVAFANAPIPYTGDSTAGTRYALSVSLVDDRRRLVAGVDYTETVTGVTITASVPTTETIRITYQSLVAAEYPAVSHAAASATRPAAIKGRDIEIRIGGAAVTDRWSSVQSVNVEWRATLEKDEELGNQQAVSQDFDIPEVTGTVELKPRDAAELLTRIKQVSGVTGDEVVGALSSVVLPILVILHSPEDGSTLKTLEIPDARFTLPGFSGQVQQKLSVTFNFESEGGILNVYKGDKPA